MLRGSSIQHEPYLDTSVEPREPRERGAQASRPAPDEPREPREQGGSGEPPSPREPREPRERAIHVSHVSGQFAIDRDALFIRVQVQVT